MASDSQKPLVSFVVLCYKTEPFVAGCLDSIFAQRHPYSFEVVVIDDRSPDGTQEVLKRYAGDPRVRLILRDTNQGHARTIEEALRATRGDLVARIDSDDRYHGDYLSHVVPVFEKYPEVGFVYGDALLMDADGKMSTYVCETIHPGGDSKGNEFIQLLHRNYVCAPTVIARRELWMAALPLPAPVTFTDWYFNLMINRRCEAYYVKKHLAVYRMHAEGMHCRMVRDKSEERTIEHILGMLYSERENSEELERAKQAARDSVYAAQYGMLATKYFGAHMNADARRCYLRAIRHRPANALSPLTLRRLAASCLDREQYNRLKRVLRPEAKQA